MRTFKFAALAAALIAAVCLSAGAVRAEEKKLTMYVAYGGPEIIAQQFEAATGIKVEFLTMSSGEVLTRLRAEKANPGADVWFGGGSDAFIQAKKEGLTAPFKAPNASRVDKAFKDPDGYWTGVSLVVVGFLANKDRLAGKGLEVPMTWDELASPDYRDEVSASNLNTSGTAYTTVSGILQIKGEKAGWPFLDKLYANIPFLTKSGSAPGKMALSGEFAVGIAPDPHILANKNPDAPLAVVYPTDGVLAWPSPVSIVAGARHPENAGKFVDWCLSPEGQKVLMQASPRVPTTDVEPLPGVPRLSDLNLVAYDILHWGNERERVVAEFNKRFPKYQ
ncbi:ABC transporter substrate-binding protein [Pseudodesulfovibrio mercurii]|nr:ABC transporter substrate-binding protein [Pseudodesulfovibrio mercurii]